MLSGKSRYHTASCCQDRYLAGIPRQLDSWLYLRLCDGCLGRQQRRLTDDQRTGVDGAGPIWHDSMLLAEQGRPITGFHNPGDLVRKTVSYAEGITTTDWYLKGVSTRDWYI